MILQSQLGYNHNLLIFLKKYCNYFLKVYNSGYLNQKKGHDFLKLTKIKVLTAINGLLTLSSLIMLFFGLCNQVNEPSRFMDDGKTIALNSANGLFIFIAIMATMVFGFAFFASWLRSEPAKAHLLRH